MIRKSINSSMFAERCKRSGCNFITPRSFHNEGAYKDLAIHVEQDHDIEKEKAEKFRKEEICKRNYAEWEEEVKAKEEKEERKKEEKRKLEEERVEKKNLHELKLAAELEEMKNLRS